jgi:hypothetical protein
MSILAVVVVGPSVCPPSEQKYVNFVVRSSLIFSSKLYSPKQQGELVHRVLVLLRFQKDHES